MRQVDYLVVVVVVVASALAPCGKGALDAGGGQLLEHGALTLLLELPAALVPVLPARAQEGQHDPGNLLTRAPDALSRALDGVAQFGNVAGLAQAGPPTVELRPRAAQSARNLQGAQRCDERLGSRAGVDGT
jgi:hypothetical protein